MTKTFKLFLTNEDGELLDQFKLVLTDDPNLEDEEADLLYCPESENILDPFDFSLESRLKKSLVRWKEV